MLQKILDIMKRTLNAYAIEAYETEKEALRAGLRAFTTWHEPEVITQEEYEELQKILEEYADR